MTTFGGQTVPPIFGGAAALDLIFLRGAGTFYNKDIDGTGVDLVQPAINVNDDLFVFVNSAFFEPIVNAGWTQVLTYNVGACEIFHRVADGTATDDFAMPATASTRNRFAQMASFGNSDPGSPPDELTLIQTGTIQDGPAGASDVWPFFAITAGGDPTDTFIIYFSFKLRTLLGGVGLAVTDNPNINPIGSIAYSQAAPAEMQWLSWGYQFQAASVSLPAGSMTYAPLTTGGVIMSQYTRWNLQ